MAGARGRENVLRNGYLGGGIWTTGLSQALIHDIPPSGDHAWRQSPAEGQTR